MRRLPRIALMIAEDEASLRGRKSWERAVVGLSGEGRTLAQRSNSGNCEDLADWRNKHPNNQGGCNEEISVVDPE
jgi:hypothetical protein